jgi:hypothetical protein
MLFVQLAFGLEPIVHVVTMCATAFEVQSICSLLDFLQTRGACELWLGPCRFSHLLFPVSENGTHVSSKAGVNPPPKLFLSPSLAQSPRLSNSVDSRLLSSP